MLTQWFDPEPTFKGLQFARELVAQGHNVRVVTGFPNYPGGVVYDGYRIRAWQREEIDGVEILRVPLYPSHNGSAIARVWNYLSFSLSAIAGVLWGSRPDVTYVYHPPATAALPAMILKWVKGVPFVDDVQDLWPDTLAATGMVSNRRVLGLVGVGMKRVYASAARVAVLSPGFKERMIESGVPAHKISVIPNWADEARIGLDQPTGPVAAGGRPFTVVFAGNLGKAQGLHTVLDAAELLAEDDVRFVMVGGGLERNELVRDAEERKLTNMSFVPRVPITEVGQYLHSADALLVHLRDDPLFTITIPSKLQAYLLAGKPILMGVSGDASAMLDEAKAGVCFPSDDSLAMARAVRELARTSPERLRAMGESGAQYYHTQLRLEVGTRKFSDLFEAAVRSKPRFESLKRVSDFVASLAMLVLLSVPMVVIATAIRLSIGGPVLFRQVRPGKFGENFTMYKFRSMSDDRDADGELLPDSQRIGSLGRFVRKTSLDELPGLFNVLRGEMSLVGPRPLLIRYTPFYTGQEPQRLEVRPGITGWAQVNGRNAVSWDERLAMDVWYVQNRSVRVDAKILLLTVSRVFKRSGVHVSPTDFMMDLDDERKGVSS